MGNFKFNISFLFFVFLIVIFTLVLVIVNSLNISISDQNILSKEEMYKIDGGCGGGEDCCEGWDVYDGYCRFDEEPGIYAFTFKFFDFGYECKRYRWTGNQMDHCDCLHWNPQQSCVQGGTYMQYPKCLCD